MTAKEELLSFLANLSEEEVETLFTHFSELSSSLEESSPLYPPERPLQTA